MTLTQLQERVKSVITDMLINSRPWYDLVLMLNRAGLQPARTGVFSPIAIQATVEDTGNTVVVDWEQHKEPVVKHVHMMNRKTRQYPTV